jgi:nucleotide-binding universal stress UspA family protein
VGDALGAEALDEASAEMRALAEAMTPAQADAARRALERASREAGEAGGEVGENLGEAAKALEKGDLEGARAALEQAAGALDEKAGLREREELGRQADEQLAELERAFGERFRTPGEAEQAVTRAERQALESDDVSPEGAVPMPGDGQGKAVPGSGDEKAGTAQGRGDLPGPRTPSNSNATGAVQPLGDQVRRRQELLAAGKATGEAPGREQVDEDTRASRVTVEYQPAEPRASYADADRVTGDVVPWSYRSLVRTYFQIVGPRGSSRED